MADDNDAYTGHLSFMLSRLLFILLGILLSIAMVPVMICDRILSHKSEIDSSPSDLAL